MGCQGFRTARLLIPAATLFLTFYALFYALTPRRYRMHGCRKWPGALFITAWWIATVELLPQVLGLLGSYSLTYGRLAGLRGSGRSPPCSLGDRSLQLQR